MATAFSYQPYMVADLKYGLELGMQPWLAPLDAFVQLSNGYLKRGVLYKREGYTEFGRLVHQEVDEVIGTAGSGAEFAGTLAKFPLRIGDVTITDGVETFTDNGDGTLTGDAGGSGTIDYDTGVFAITFNSAPGDDPTATYDWFPGLPCMGLFNYTASSGSQEFLAFTTKRVGKYNPVSHKFVDLLGVDTFTGEDHQWFWVANWLNIAFLTNGKDQVQIYDGSTVAPLVLDLSEPADAANDLDTALLIFPYHDRIVFLRTNENGAEHPQRARWTKIGKYAEANPTDWVDAPTHEWIMGAGFIRDDLIVFFERSVWALKYTGDYRLPFAWKRVATNEGLISPMGLADFSNELIGLGSTRLIGTDGSDSYNIDDKIPDYVLSMNQSAMAYAYAGVADQDNQAWFSYVSINADMPDKVLVFNYDEQSFSDFDLPMYCFGYYDLQADPTWDDIDQTWDEIEWAWDDRKIQGGYPLLMGGSQDGYVYQLQTGGSDNGIKIDFYAKTGQWNPFIKNGYKARLGWVDFLVDRDPEIDLTVEYYVNHESQPYLTDTFALGDATMINQKVWLRSYVHCEGEFHQLRLVNEAENQTPVIHAIVPYFCQAGVIS